LIRQQIAILASHSSTLLRSIGSIRPLV
jgi:hypothetical protein